jgi:hypothetical protein
MKYVPIPAPTPDREPVLARSKPQPPLFQYFAVETVGSGRIVTIDPATLRPASQPAYPPRALSATDSW